MPLRFFLWYRLLLGAMLVGVYGTAEAQNSYSFINSQSAVSNFRLASVRPASSCAGLQYFEQPDVSIISAVNVPATDQLPAHCRVRGMISPEIQFEVALPDLWNRRLYMHGNGGFAGQSLEQPAQPVYRLTALRHGFVTAVTNAGHDGQTEPGASFAYRNLQKRIDYGYRAVHLTAATAKLLISVYYDHAASYSYFDGCSNGGRQAMMAAQRFPGDFDGIVAGAPLMNFSDSAVSFLWLARALRETTIPKEKMPWLAEAIFRRCDAKDGLVDKLLGDPRQCDFNPIRDLQICTAGRTAGCFTNAEVGTLKKIYDGPQVRGQPYFHGQLPGAEHTGVSYAPPYQDKTGWSEWVDDARGIAYPQTNLGEQFVKYLAFPTQDPNAEVASFDFDNDPQRMTLGRELIDAVNPDLSAFQTRGGKLLMYFGWADPSINPLTAVDYYEKVAALGGAKTGDFLRLFMMPGVFHCFGGYGPDRLDAMTAVIDWVEQGLAPNSLIATKTETHAGGKVLRERPICAYPQVARYKGRGSIDEARNFLCEAPTAAVSQ